jgi:hypothetical protein
MALTFRIAVPFNLEDMEARILKTYGSEIRDELQQRTPGTAADHWKVSEPVEGKIVISNEAKYLPFIERGTGLYGPGHILIRPKTASVLTWMEGNQRVFAKYTRGMKPQPFVNQAVQAGMATARGELNGNNR